MKALILGGLVAAVTAMAAGAETVATPAEQALLARPDFVEWLTEVGVGARVVGECERHAEPDQADRYVASIAALDFDSVAGASDFEREVQGVVLKAYAEGRAAGPSSKLDAAACARLISEHETLRAKAGSVLRAAR